MQRIPKSTVFTAEWKQPRRIDRFYELRSGSLLFATLDFQSPFTSIAYAETADGKWSFNRTGFWKRKITISNDSDAEEIALYQPAFWSGAHKIEFADGKSYIWKHINFMATQWAFINSHDELMLVIHKGIENQSFSDFFKTQMTVDIHPTLAPEGNPSVLLPLALYLMILQKKDADSGV